MPVIPLTDGQITLPRLDDNEILDLLSNNFIINIEDKDAPRPGQSKPNSDELAYIEYANTHGIGLTSPTNERCSAHYRVFRRDTDHKLICVPIPCKDRYCPNCNGMRERQRRKKVWKRTSEMLNSTGKIRLKFLTLTIKNSWDLDADLKVLHVAMRNLIRSNFGKKYIKRGIWVIEWTAHPGKPVHVHIHAMIETDYYKIPFERLRREWMKRTDNRGRFVRITSVKGKHKTVANYMSKYMVKDDWTHPAWKSLSDSFKGRQLMGIWGRFTGKRDDDSTYTFLGSTLEWVDYYKWVGGELQKYWEPVPIPLTDFLDMLAVQ